MTQAEIRSATTHRLFWVALAAATGLVLALTIGWASPAAAFIDEEAGQDTSEQEPAAETDGGFVEDEGGEPAPTGGVDAGLGGTAAESGLGVAHAGAAALLALTAAAHVIRVRRFATADA